MSLLINCPLEAEIQDLSNLECEVHFGQMLRMALTRVNAPSFTALAAMETKAEWDTALGATDDSKVQLTPLFNNFVIPMGEAATIGPDSNETYFGELKVVGKTAITCTGRFQGLTPEIKAQLDSYLSEGSIFGNMGIYLIDEHGRSYGTQVGGTGAVSAIPISSFFIGDVGSEGYNTLNYCPFSFNLKGGWFNNLAISGPTTDFDIITYPNA